MIYKQIEETDKVFGRSQKYHQEVLPRDFNYWVCILMKEN